MFKSKTVFEENEPPRWWRWARQHPGALLLAGIVLVALLAPHPRAKNGPPADMDADETPLFI